MQEKPRSEDFLKGEAGLERKIKFGFGHAECLTNERFSPSDFKLGFYKRALGPPGQCPVAHCFLSCFQDALPFTDGPSV